MFSISLICLMSIFTQLPPGYESEGPKRKPKNDPMSPEEEEKTGPHFAKKPQNHTVLEGGCLKCILYLPVAVIRFILWLFLYKKSHNITRL